MHIPKSIDRNVLASVAFLVLVPVILHFSFSWMGFNPTDDGFTLAYSRRILEGQIPHRDFIIIRPFLSPLIHVPFVLWGGDYTFWFSRFFVWFELACISWIWVSIINRFFKFPFTTTVKFLVALIALAASAHTFPIMAWHTIDGLFLSSVGLALCTRSQNRVAKMVGYALMATAYLCKQSFIFLAPLSLFILDDWREVRYWLAIIFPGVIYVIYLFPTGAMPDAILQLTSQTGIISTGVKRYVSRETLLGLLAGYLSARLIFGVKVALLLQEKLQKWLGITMLVAVPLLITVIRQSSSRLLTASFGVFGIVVGIVLYSVIEEPEKEQARVRIASLGLLSAWSASLSLGYNFPVLALGPLLAVLIAYGFTVQVVNEKVLLSSLAIATIASLSSFGIARTNYIYREQPASHLIEPLNGVLPGGALIKTNQNMYDYLLDLNQAIKLVTGQNRSYEIVPSAAALWVQSRQVNPLPIDWTQATELSRQELTNRVIESLNSERESKTVIVSKIVPDTLADGFTPLDDNNDYYADYYAVVRYVRTYFAKVGETRFFDLYR